MIRSRFSVPRRNVQDAAVNVHLHHHNFRFPACLTTVRRHPTVSLLQFSPITPNYFSDTASSPTLTSFLWPPPPTTRQTTLTLKILAATISGLRRRNKKNACLAGDGPALDRPRRRCSSVLPRRKLSRSGNGVVAGA
ncbi:hypothetical protein SDJN03_09694, partial [Cucurbita argyrosperma subsp. sororia]